MKYKNLLKVILIFSLSGFPSLLVAKTYPAFGPFTTRNQNPIYVQTLNLTPTRATTLPRKTFELRIDSSYSNIFETGASSAYSMREDMELWRLALEADFAPKDNLEVGLEIPFIQLWHGFLDPFIQKFHKAFGLPNGGRDKVPNNQFNFYFDKGKKTIYRVKSQDMNLGDITFHFKNHILDEGVKNPAVAWFFDLKFPTGVRSKGLGNGVLDYGLGVALEKSYKRIHGYLNTAYYVSARDDVLEPYTHSEFFSYAAAVELTLLDTWSLIAQVDGGTPLLKGTNMDEWDGVPLDLLVGFKGREKDVIGKNDLIWQFAFSEDATSTGPSVDFTVFLSIGTRF